MMGYYHLDEALPMPANPRRRRHPAVGFLPPNTEGYLWDGRGHLLNIFGQGWSSES